MLCKKYKLNNNLALLWNIYLLIEDYVELNVQ